MGLEGGANKTYVSIVKSRLTIRVPKNTENAVERVLEKGPKAGLPIYELQYPRLRGNITDISYETHSEYGDSVAIEVKSKSDNKTYCLKISWDDFGVRTNFVKQLSNVDHTKEVCFIAFPDKEKNDKTVFLIAQGKDADDKDIIVPFKYTKENPEGIPEPTQKMVRGTEKWDYSDNNEFLYQVFIKESSRFKNMPVDRNNDSGMSLETDPDKIPEHNSDCETDEITTPEETTAGIIGGDENSRPPF